MSISDLLWACPECGLDRGLADDRGETRCRGCDARFRRGAGATIERTSPSGERAVRSAADWIDRLPEPAALLEDAPDDAPIRAARVEARSASGEGVVRDGGAYLNRYEILGGAVDAVLELWPDRIALRSASSGREGADAGETSERWPLDDLTAVQASSSSLQIKARDRALHSFRFQDDSVYLWELLVRAALDVRYRVTGRGEIVEYQPRIVTARR